MQLCYIKHEQKKNARKKKLYLCWRHSPRCSVRSQSSNFDVTTSSLFYFLLLCCAVWFCFSESCEQTERCYKMPQTSHWGAFFPSLPFVVSLGLLQSTLGVVSPSSVSSVVPFDLCCAQLFSLLIIRCLSYLKKNPGGTYLRCNAVFSLFSISVFQWEASQTNLLSPDLFYNTDKLKMITSCFLCAIALCSPLSLLEVQNGVPICCKHCWWFGFIHFFIETR